jgi:hypothetical protein
MSHPADEKHFCLRRNRDGTVDSICTKCFLTVYRGESEVERRQAEENHVCNPWVVERLEIAERR